MSLCTAWYFVVARGLLRRRAQWHLPSPSAHWHTKHYSSCSMRKLTTCYDHSICCSTLTWTSAPSPLSWPRSRIGRERALAAAPPETLLRFSRSISAQPLKWHHHHSTISPFPSLTCSPTWTRPPPVTPSPHDTTHCSSTRGAVHSHLAAAHSSWASQSTCHTRAPPSRCRIWEWRPSWTSKCCRIFDRTRDNGGDDWMPRTRFDSDSSSSRPSRGPIVVPPPRRTLRRPL